MPGYMCEYIYISMCVCSGYVFMCELVRAAPPPFFFKKALVVALVLRAFGTFS